MTQVEIDRSVPVSDQATAAHELGHAFVARETGLTVGKLKVNKWFGGGWCEIRDNLALSDEASNWACAVSLAAGREAEEIWRDRVGLATPWSWGTGGDDAMLRDLETRLGRSIEPARAEARERLEGVWAELEELIAPLARRGYLPGIDDA